MMDGIFNNKSKNVLHGVLCPKAPNDSVETAGSLAMFHSLFESNVYDEFTSSNPFAVDYSMYSDCVGEVAYSGFLESFSNAVSIIGTSGDCGASFSGDCGGCSCGGFTSVC